MKMRLSRAFYILTGDQGSVDGFTNVWALSYPDESHRQTIIN